MTIINHSEACGICHTMWCVHTKAAAKVNAEAIMTGIQERAAEEIRNPPEDHEPRKVWTVYGESGSYSDYGMWLVRCFLNEEEAKHFTKKLNAALPAACEAYDKAVVAWQTLGYKERELSGRPKPTHPLDPRATSIGEASYDYTDVDFGWPEQEAVKQS